MGCLSWPCINLRASEAFSSTSMRYLSENIQFSIFPQTSSHLYGFGFSESVSDHIPRQMDSKLNAYDSSFYMDTKPRIQDGQISTGIYSQSPFVNHQSGLSSVMTIKRLDCPSFGSSHFTTKATTPAYHSKQPQHQPSHVERVPAQPNLFGTIRRTRKRPIEHADTATKGSPEIVAGPRGSRNDKWATNKKMMSFQEKLQTLDYQIQKESTDIQRDRVPPRRSQKLAAKITALQKLVSPFGKTDTASVLHEASIFIKVLQDQIENSLHAITSTSMEDQYPESKIIGDSDGQFDLRGKGFCLFPVALTKNLIKEESLNHFSTTNTLLPLNSLTQF